MTHPYTPPDELKAEVLKWANQIGVYNEGCMCILCQQKILDHIEKAFQNYNDKQPQIRRRDDKPDNP